jgi:competence CoiA-like predicted nuclease
MEKPTVNHILNTETGEYYTAEELLGTDKISQFKLRHEIEERIQRQITNFVCAACMQKIKLRAGEKNRFYFAHLRDSDDCPIKTDTKYTKKEWLALIYHGAKESTTHIKLKNKLYDILNLDDRFSDVKLEKSVKDIKEKIRWKKPDLQCLYNNRKNIFEIQISHTFISVIVAREIFYKENEMPLFWIFDEFTPEPEYIKAFQGDIFAHNNCNVLVFDNETFAYSMENNKFHLMAYWMEPFIENNKIKSRWNNKRINFDELIYDDINNRAYYYDYERNYKIIEYQLQKELIFDIIREDDNYSKRIDLFKQSINTMEKYNLRKWTDKDDIYNLYDLFRILLSIKERKNYGYKNVNPIWMLNLFYNSRKEFYWIVLKYIKKTNYDKYISQEKRYSGLPPVFRTTC